MNEPIDLVLAQWLVDGPDTGTRDGLVRTLELTSTTKQRSRWRFPFAWLPMGPAVPPVGRAAPVGTAIVVALLALALVVAALAAGSRPRLPAPFGLAGSGLIAYGSGGRVLVTDVHGAAPRPVVETNGTQSAPAFSPTGDRIAFWSLPVTGKVQLIVAGADGSNPRDVLHGAVSRAADVTASPAWSPEGTELAFVVHERLTDSRLFVARADGGGVRELPVRVGIIADPAFSPAGDLLAFRRIVDPGVALVVVRREGSGERELVTETVGPSAPDDPGGHGYNLGRTMQAFGWSPQGTRIAYTSGSADVMVVDVDGNRRVVSGGDDPAAAEFNPAWSPSGTRLAFFGADGTEVVVADVDGPGRRRLAADWTAEPCLLFWSHDERWLLGSTESSGCPAAAGQLMRIDLETGRAARLRDGVRADGLPSVQRVAP